MTTKLSEMCRTNVTHLKFSRNTLLKVEKKQRDIINAFAVEIKVPLQVFITAFPECTITDLNFNKGLKRCNSLINL